MRIRAAVRGIRDAATLDALGWRVSVPAFRLLRVAGVVGALCGSAVAGAVVTDWLRNAFVSGPDLAVVGAVGLGVYVLVGYAVRETLTSRRSRLTAHPQRAFFRALDIPRRTVVLAECLDRMVWPAAAVCGACAGVAARSAAAGVSPAAVATLVQLPFLVVSGALALTTALAAWPRIAPRPQPLTMALAGVAVGGMLAVSAHVAVSLAGESPLPPFAVLWDPIPVVVATAIVLAVVSTTGALRTLRRSDFVDPAEPDGSCAPTLLSARRHNDPWIRVVLSDLAPPGRMAALSRVLFAAWGSGALVVGVQVFTLAPAGWRAPELAVDRIAGVVAFFFGVTVAEMLSQWIGPSALAARWRAAWEAGADENRLAAVPVGVALLAAVAASGPIAVAAAAAGGHWEVPVAVVWAAISCAWIAVAVLPADPPRADGTAPASLAAAVFCVVTSAGVTVVVLMTAMLGVVWVGVLAVLFVGRGAVWVTRRRVLALPSRPLV